MYLDLSHNIYQIILTLILFYIPNLVSCAVLEGTDYFFFVLPTPTAFATVLGTASISHRISMALRTYRKPH